MTDLRALVAEKRLLVTAGSGGVGKTTTAAALAVQAAAVGRRTAVLTIDPARRLAQSLGVASLTGAARAVDPALFAAAGVPIRGELHAMMLDQKTTADTMVRRFAPDAAAAERILENRYYQAFSTSLAGTQEYMAIEQVKELLEHGDYDLVVLDTPPAVHALDFLDAPERLLNALDNRAVNWLYRPAGATAGYGARLLGRGRQMVFKSLEKLTGGPFFEDLATFLSAFSALFDAFRQGSRAVQGLLRAESTSFLLVTAPNPATVQEAVRFSGQLGERELPFGGFICNRVHLPYPHLPPETEQLARLSQALGGELAPDRRLALLGRMLVGLADHNRLAERDAAAIDRLTEVAGRPPVIVPLFAEDVHDVPGLLHIGAHLMGNSPRAAASVQA